MSENVIWTVDGRIKDGQKEAFDAVMKDLIEATSKEEGTLNYEWTIAEDQTNFHVYERYQNADAAMAHLANFGTKAELFFAAVDMTGFVVYGAVTDAIREGIAALNPVYMTPFGGFAK